MSVISRKAAKLGIVSVFVEIGYIFPIDTDLVVLLRRKMESEVFNGNARRFAMKPDRNDLDVIAIPTNLHGLPVSELNISVRLHNVLVSNNVRSLGMLHGVSFSRVGALKNCGLKCLRELRDLVREMQNGGNFFSPQTTRGSDFISIPAEAHELIPSDLPLSARLASILQYMKVQRLGDLDGKAFVDLLKVKNCGRVTLREFTNLLKRVETGEFQPPTGSFSAPAIADMIRLLDRLLMEMSPRDREVLMLRFGANAGKMLTYTAIASKLQLSNERIRQIISKKLETSIKSGGPKLRAYLKGVADLCRQLACPLTPMLFAHWVDQYSVQRQFSLTFYVRLLGQLNHDIPIWVNSPEPCDRKFDEGKYRRDRDRNSDLSF
jgi:hypothetical protein